MDPIVDELTSGVNTLLQCTGVVIWAAPSVVSMPIVAYTSLRALGWLGRHAARSTVFHEVRMQW